MECRACADECGKRAKEPRMTACEDACTEAADRCVNTMLGLQKNSNEDCADCAMACEQCAHECDRHAHSFTVTCAKACRAAASECLSSATIPATN